MNDIVARLTALEKREQGLILNEILDGPDGPGSRGFLQYLKSLSPEPRKALMAWLPLSTAQWIEERLVDLQPAEGAKVKKMELKLNRLLARLPSLAKKMEAATRRAAKRMAKNRELIRSHFSVLERIVSDQKKGLPRGALQKPAPPGAALIELPSPHEAKLPNTVA